MAALTPVFAGFGQDGNFHASMQTVTTKVCVIYTAYSHITFSRFISSGSVYQLPLSEQMALAAWLAGYSGFYLYGSAVGEHHITIQLAGLLRSCQWWPVLLGFSGLLSPSLLSQIDWKKILNSTNWLACNSVTNSFCITVWCTSPSETASMVFCLLFVAFDCLDKLCRSLSAPWQTTAVGERCIFFVFFSLCVWMWVFIQSTDCLVMHINNLFKIMMMKKEHKSNRLSSVNLDNSEVCRIYLISALVLWAFISVWIHLCSTVDL